MQKLEDFKLFLDAVQAVRSTPGLEESDINSAAIAAYNIYTARSQDDVLKAVAVRVVQGTRTNDDGQLSVEEQAPQDETSLGKGRKPRAKKT